MNTFNNSFEDTALQNSQSNQGSNCANCWGYQQYDDKFRELPEDVQVDVINHQAMYTFIKEFVVQQIDGVKLKSASSSENDSLSCDE